jgi:predicted MFS family arabinose efflux permease
MNELTFLKQSKILVSCVSLIGLLSVAILFFEPLYLYDIKEKSDLILFIIPIYVFLLAFFVGKPVERLGLLYTILFGFVLMCFSIFFQVFYFSNTSMTHMIFSFICLVCMWGLGRTMSVLINAVDSDSEG